MADSVNYGQVDLDLLTGDERIVVEGKQRFQRVENWEADFRSAFLEDLRFSHADSRNMWAWPNDIRRNRDVDERPVLTVNKTFVHCMQIINDSRQNPASVTVRPTGGEATFESAQVLEGVIRRIEYNSNAQAAYDKAIEFQVFGGIGYWRVVTDYAGDDSFDQEIYIRRIKDPLNVYMDPDINQVDGSDSRFAFVFDDLPKEEFKQRYPKHKDVAGKAAFGNADNWLTKDHIRVAEYYRRIDVKHVIVAFTNPITNTTQIMRKDEIDPILWEQVASDPSTRTREVTDHKVEWFLIAGDEIIDRADWPGKFIPVVRIIGSEIIVGGELDRKGHTRALIDPQRIYNYWTSSAVEQVALQAKMPYMAPVAAIEGYETYWESANRINYAVLPYKHIDDDGQPIPPPTRQTPPQMAGAYIEGLKISANEMMMVSGQYQAVMGQPSNETSGKAINERQRQGENATYHYIQNYAHGIRYTGKILIDLIPKIYDTPRVMKIMAEDGTGSDVQLDPQAKAAYVQNTNKVTQEVTRIFNPNVGKYEVESDIGPSYGTRRQEAFNAFEKIATSSPVMMSVVGDLMFKNADFPGADEIAERLKRMVPAQALGTGAPPEVGMLQQQNMKLTQEIQKLLNELAVSRIEVKGKTQNQKVDEFKAITDRLKALLPTMINPKDIAQQIVDMMKLEKQNAHELTVQDLTHQHQTTLQDDMQEHQAGLQDSQQDHQVNLAGIQNQQAASSGGGE